MVYMVQTAEGRELDEKEAKPNKDSVNRGRE